MTGTRDEWYVAFASESNAGSTQFDFPHMIRSIVGSVPRCKETVRERYTVRNVVGTRRKQHAQGEADSAQVFQSADTA